MSQKSNMNYLALLRGNDVFISKSPYHYNAGGCG